MSLKSPYKRGFSSPPTDRDGTLVFGLSADLTPAQRARLRLHVCGETYDFSDATLTSGSLYSWPDANLDWSSVSNRAVALSIRPNAPRFGRARESCFFQEHSAPGTEVCSAQEVRATDADGDTLVYTLGGRDGAGFAIDSATGVITLGSASSDYETNESTCEYGLRSSIRACYRLAVTATDPGGSSDTMEIWARVFEHDESPFGNIGPIPPSPPRNLTAADGAASVQLSWDAPTSRGRPATIAGYRVEYSDDLHRLPQRLRAGSWRTLTNLNSGTTTTYSDSPGPTPGTTRYYRVRASNNLNAVGYRALSWFSNTASARRLYGPRPGEISSGQNDSNQVVITLRMSEVLRSEAAAELFSVKINNTAVEIIRLGILERAVDIRIAPLSVSNGDPVEIRYADPDPYSDSSYVVVEQVTGMYPTRGEDGRFIRDDDGNIILTQQTITAGGFSWGGPRVLESALGVDATSFCIVTSLGSESFASCGEQRTVQGMSAQFTNPVEPHDGTAFDARLELSVEPAAGFSYKVFQGDPSTGRESVLQVTNGTVERARRDGANQNRRWIVTIAPSGDEAVTLTLPATTDCAALNAICSADGAMLQEAVTKTVPGPDNDDEEETEQATQAAALTVAYTAEPAAEHDGSSAFTFAFSFNETLHADYSYKTMRDRSLTVMQGGTKLTPHVRRMVKGSNRSWEATVTPAGNAAISIALGPTGSCSETGAMCTEGGTALSNALPANTVQGPVGVSVADASVQEAAGATLDFAVTLSRAASAAVTVDYATSDGTATAGSDYAETSGTLTFAVGEREKTVAVPVLDDGHDEGSETFTLTLSNVEGNAYLADAEAIGTIENSDPMPQAWLARFGRTLAGQAVDMVAARLEGGGATQVTVGGQRLDLSGSAAAPAEAEELRGVFESLGFDEDAPAVSTRTMSGRELLLGSSFSLSAGGEGDGPAWAAWGRVATGGFDAAEDGVRMSGSVTSAFLGADVARGRWLAGLALSMSEGEGDYTHEETGAGGDVESTLTALYPYARLKVNERVDVWGLAGWGTGELTLTHGHPDDAEEETYRPGIAMRMGAVGARGEVLSPSEPDGLALALKTDAFWVRMTSEAVRGDPGNLAGSEADATRLRLTLEGSRRFETGGGHLTPRLELGLRHDGGDAETGSGVELGASVRYEGEGVSAEGSVRTLIAHESQGYEEWGASGALRIDPGASGRGLSLTLAPTWGEAAGGAERLWSVADPRGLAPGGAFEAGRRLEAELGYGFAVMSGRYTGTPKLGLGLADEAREVRLGWGLAEARRSGLVFGLDVEAARSESAEGEPGHRMGAGFGWRLEGAAGGAFELRFEGERREAANDDGAAEHRIGVRLGARW